MATVALAGGNPIAEFTAAPLFGCAPLTVNFTDASTPNPDTITSWDWTFGDGGVSTNQNPAHIYDTPGLYTVTLDILDSNSSAGTRTRVNYVQVIGPDVAFTSDVQSVVSGGAVSFMDLTMFGAPITGWTWDFGDGGTSNLQNPTRVYTDAGSYSVSLQVTDIDGCSRTVLSNAYISVNPLDLVRAEKTAVLVVDADGDGKPSPGDTLRYTISVTNTGAVDAVGVQLADVVTTNTLMTDTNSINVSPMARDDGYSTTAGASLVVADPGVLGNDNDLDSQPAPIVVSSADTNSVGGGTVSVASTGGFTYDAAPGFSGTDTFSYEVTDGLATDSATVTINVAEVADLSVEKMDDVDPVGTGATLTYTIIVSNAGPTTASEVTVTDTVPAGVSLQMASGDFACSNPAPGVVVCTGGPLAAGAIATITIPVTPTVGGVTLTNKATVSTTAIDGNPGNDTATEETAVNANDPPVAVDDSYTSFGNVRLAIDMTSGVLSNDTDPNMDMLVVSDFDTNSALTGVVAVAANGAFTYDPPAGVLGTDSWTYVVSDGVATDTGTVTVAIGGPIVWFVDNRVAGPGTGTQADPFVDLGSLQGNEGAGDTDQPGDVIFIYEGTGAAYTGGLDVEADQRLVGEPAGLILSGKQIVPAAGNRPRITHTAEGSKLGANVELDSVVFDSNGNFGISGFNFGTLTMNNVSARSVGRGSLFLSTGTANLTGITCISSNSTTDGLVLNSVDGTAQITGGTLAAASGRALRISGGSANLTIACSIANSVNRSVEIENRTGGSVALTGPVSDSGSGILVRGNSGGTVIFSGASKVLNTGSSTAVDLNNNTGTTINFTNGGLDIDTTNGTGFSAAAGGTVNVSGAGNTINTGTGRALDVQNTTIGAVGVTFESVSVNGAPSGIVLVNTGTSGGLSVTGSGAAIQGGNDSGGVIQNTTGDGIVLNNAWNVTLQNMTIGDPTVSANDSDYVAANIAGDGIQATAVTGLTLRNATLARTGDHGVNALNVTNLVVDNCQVLNAGNGQEEHGLNLDEQRGDNFVIDSLFDGFNETGIELINASGSVDLTVTNTTFQDNQATAGNAGEEAILLEAQGSATIVALVTGDANLTTTSSIFDDMAQQAIQAISLGGSSMIHLTVENSRFLETQAGDAVIIMNPDNAGSGNVTVQNCFLTDDTFGPFGLLAKNDSSGTLDVTVRDNEAVNLQLMSINHDDLGSGGAANGTTRALIQGNDNLIGSDNIGIDIIATETPSTGPGPDLSVTVVNNDIELADAGSFSFAGGMRIEAQQQSRVHIDVRDNTMNSDPSCCGGAGFELKLLDTAVVGIENLTGDPATFLNAQGNSFTGPALINNAGGNTISAGNADPPVATTRPSP